MRRFYDSDCLFTCILDESALEATMRYRPKLRQEMYEEFLYNLQNDYYSKSRREADSMILFLVSFFGQQEGEELWKYCSWADFSPRGDKWSILNDIESALKLIGQNRIKVKWLEEKIMGQLMSMVETEIKGNFEALQELGKFYSYCVDDIHVTMLVYKFVDDV